MRAGVTNVGRLKAHIVGIRVFMRGADKVYRAAVQDIADRFGVEIATGQLSNIWQMRRSGGEWVPEYDTSEDPKIVRAFKALADLDALAEEIRIGPSNMERFNPKKRKEKHDTKTEGR